MARDAVRKLGVWARKPAAGLAEVLDPEKFSPLIRPTLAAHYRAVKDYWANAYDGPITLFRARVQPLFGSHAPDLGWSAIAADGVTIHIVPGNHDTLLDEPFVKALAERLSYALSRAGLRDLGKLGKHFGPAVAQP